MMVTILIEQICRILLNPSSDDSKLQGSAVLFQVFQLFGFYFADTQKKVSSAFCLFIIKIKILIERILLMTSLEPCDLVVKVALKNHTMLWSYAAKKFCAKYFKTLLKPASRQLFIKSTYIFEIIEVSNFFTLLKENPKKYLKTFL